jgi:hypothetical protein
MTMLRRFLRLFADYRDIEHQVAMAQVRLSGFALQLEHANDDLRLERRLVNETREQCAKAESDLREWKKAAERGVENATGAHHLYEQAKADERAQRELATEFKTLFLEEKAKHQEALELLADWQGQRLLGRTIFHHAPLLQPDAKPTRERVPVQKSGRDMVREETKAFEDRARTIEQTIQRNRRAPVAPHLPPSQQQAADLSAKEQADFFGTTLTDYAEGAAGRADAA